MPELQAVDTIARQVKVGDNLNWSITGAAQPYAVTEVDHKVKWSTIVVDRLDGTKKIRIETDAPVRVFRNLPTEAEKAAAMHRVTVSSLGRRLYDAYAMHAAAIDKVVTNAAKGYRTSHWELQSLGEAAANLEPWARVAHLLADGDGIDIITAARGVGDNLKRDLLRDNWRGGSTSVWSNALDSEHRAAAARFLDAIRR